MCRLDSPKSKLSDVCDLLLIGGRQLVEDKAEVSSQAVPCLLLTCRKLKSYSANPPPTVNGKQSCRPVRREPRAIFFRVGEMPLVSEFHCIGIPLCTQPWESGVGKPLRAAGQSLELWFQCIEKLVKNRMNAVVSRPGRGGETGGLQIQLLGFLDKPSQVAFTIILKRRPVPIGAIVWPIWILSNPFLTYQFISEPGQMQIDAGIRIALAGVRGQFNPTFDQSSAESCPKASHG